MVDINTQFDFEKIISKKGFLDFEVDPTLDLFVEIQLYGGLPTMIIIG